MIAENMMVKLSYITFKTKMGWMGILASDRGLLATTLPQPSSQEARQRLGHSAGQASFSPRQFADLIESFQSYFSGRRVVFSAELDLSGATPFQRDVWAIVRGVPCGETRSYLGVAGQIGRLGAARAVGQALARNPLPIIIPCHRIVASDGRLGGFSGGVTLKRKLLELEASSMG